LGCLPQAAALISNFLRDPARQEALTCPPYMSNHSGGDSDRCWMQYACGVRFPNALCGLSFDKYLGSPSGLVINDGCRPAGMHPDTLTHAQRELGSPKAREIQDMWQKPV
jgi:hypothetical protein